MNRYLLQAPAGSRYEMDELRAIEHIQDLPLTEQFELYEQDGLELHPRASLQAMKSTSDFRNLNTPFNKQQYIAPRRVGNLMDDRWSHAALTYERWWEEYLHTRLPLASIVTLTDIIYSELDPALAYNRNFIFNALWTRIFHETDMGFYPEFAGLMLAQDIYGACRRAAGYEDTSLHLDLVCDHMKFAFQIKPPTFATPSTRFGLVRDQMTNFSRQLFFEQVTGFQVFYLISDDLLADQFNPIPLREVIEMSGWSDFGPRFELLSNTHNTTR